MNIAPGDLLWPEVAMLIEAVILKWSYDQKFQGQTAGKISFHGNRCIRLSCENTSHVYGVVRGYQPMRECLLMEHTTPDRFQNQNHAANDNEFLRRLQQVTFGHAYEKAKQLPLSLWQERPEHWPRLIDFCRHVRNGCFHGNTYDIRHPVVAGTEWRGLALTATDDGKDVMGQHSGHFGIADTIALLVEFQKEIRRQQLTP